MNFIILTALALLIFFFWCYSPKARKFRFDFLAITFICLSAINLAYALINVYRGQAFFAFTTADVIFTAVSVFSGILAWLAFAKIDNRKK